MQDRYAVIGNPIEHSKSPLIHAAFAKQTGENLTYAKILGNLKHFEQDAIGFFQQGGRGLNVTVPFKERAWRLADSLGSEAQSAGAVNTLVALPAVLDQRDLMTLAEQLPGQVHANLAGSGDDHLEAAVMRDIFERVKRIAEGAALMTDTKMRFEIVSEPRPGKPLPRRSVRVSRQTPKRGRR